MTKQTKVKKEKKQKCYTDDRFMYCFCGKCKAKGYDLPKDFRKIIKLEVTYSVGKKQHGK